MKTDYKNINSFEALTIVVIFLGMVLVGNIAYRSLSAETRQEVFSAFHLLDMHQETLSSVEQAKFIVSIPEDFYKEFYLAWTQVITLPADTFEFPVAVAERINRNVVTIFHQLSDQAVRGYTARAQTSIQIAQVNEPTIEGKVLGLSVLVTPEQKSICDAPTVAKQPEELKIAYAYPGIDFKQLKFFSRLVERE